MKSNEPKNINILDKLGDIKYMKEFFNLLKNHRVSIFSKLLILLMTLITVAYVFSPLDILPGWLNELGYIKNLVIGAAMFTFVGSMIKNALAKANTKEKLSQNGESKIIQFRFQNPPPKSGPHNKTNWMYWKMNNVVSVIHFYISKC